MLRMNLEIPMVKRRYERRWPIPASVRRYCVWSEAPYDDVAGTFAEVLTHIGPRSSKMLLECSELYAPESEWVARLGKTVVEVEDSGNRDKATRDLEVDENVILKYGNYNYSFLCSSGDSLGCALRFMKPLEWYITFWSVGTPATILLEWMHSAKLKRPEPYFLQNLGRYDPVVFLSYEHVHMEIMVINQALGNKIALYLTQQCDGGET